ncbi:GNAT family N-acetyltransferase [Paenibacillus sp. WLX1005]|uniref:GNAT family N-acetyltransferase n=1 Tax=Paenibacillus sp. WLX1005 TaxID=3243766 RepID=UPI0039842995
MESSSYDRAPVRIREHQQGEDLPISLLLLADPDESMLQRYMNYCRWWMAEYDGIPVGACGALQRGSEEWEIMNIAVLPDYAGQGIGSDLLRHVLESLERAGGNLITVCTGNSSIGPLALYQKHGFRITDVETDYFVRHYGEPIIENGITCRDRITLTLHCAPSHSGRNKPSVLPGFQAAVYIRIAQIRDSGPLIRMKKKLDAQTTYMLLEPGERTMTEPEQRDMIRYALRSANSNIFLAEYQGQIIGYLEAMGGKVVRNRHTIYIVVGVLQEYANRGVGRRLFHSMLHWAEDRGVHRIELTVQSVNVRGLHLYRSLGFRMEGIQKDALLVNNQYVDLIQMSLLL